VDNFLRLKTTVIHLNKESGSGGVSAEELKNACKIEEGCDALIVNALGEKSFDEVEERSVFLDKSALDWIASLGIRLIISDIYESKAKHGVFFYLFKSGISTVCCPVNLHLINAPEVSISCFFIPHESAVQIPCRVIAEF
jgi:kynurenine formamidase